MFKSSISAGRSRSWSVQILGVGNALACCSVLTPQVPREGCIKPTNELKKSQIFCGLICISLGFPKEDRHCGWFNVKRERSDCDDVVDSTSPIR
jgi:hypothetical protein